MTLSELDKDIVTARVVARREREEAEQRVQQQRLADQDARRRLSEAAQAQSFFKHRSPARNRWPELIAFDEKIAALDLREQQLINEIARLEDEVRQAEEADRHALSAWVAGGEQGARPAPAA